MLLRRVPTMARASVTSLRLMSCSNAPKPGEPEFTGPIKRQDLTIAFARSGGPGGQHVNKVSTKAEVRLKVEDVPWLNDRTKQRLLQVEKKRINKQGELVVTSTKTRSQKQNVEDAVERLTEMCIEASRLPLETTAETKKRIKDLDRKFNEQRLKEKKMKSTKKSDRRMRER